jgi:3-hydroxybutyryl-CoA dehydrogenase
MKESETYKVGVIGLGLLGRGIAASLIAGDVDVIAFTEPASGYAAARAVIQDSIDDLIRHGEQPSSLSRGWKARYVEAEELCELRGCDYVIESISEDLDAKSVLFDSLETLIGESIPIASNTSAIPISVLQQGRRCPNRFVGMHWAEPCHLTRFLEVVRGRHTDEPTLRSTLALARRTGKEPTLVEKDIEGFIVNRLGYAMYREALYLLEAGVGDAEQIDLAFRNAMGLWSSIAGPFRWMDLTGLPAYAKVMKRLFPLLNRDTEVPKTMQDLVSNGALGIANGRGFYTYTDQEREDWQRRLHENVWRVREMQNTEFPIDPESR